MPKKRLKNLSSYGYIRVSSESQKLNSSLDAQRKELISNGIPEETIFEEIGSANANLKDRPILLDLVENKLRKGDILMVTKLDRCSRSTLDFLKLQEILFKKEVNLIVLDLPHSNDLATNKLISTTLAAIATFENERRRERQMMGIERAKKEGKFKGRKSCITPDLVKRVKILKEEKGLSVIDIAKIIGKGRSTVYKILKEELGYVSNRLVKKRD